MGKSVITIERMLEKQKPFFKGMRRLANWYEANPVTPHEIAEKIRVIHDNFDRARKMLDVRHASEIMPLKEKQLAIREEAKELGRKHLKEKEDLTLGFAQTEMDLLQGKITELPTEIKPIHKDPGWLWKLFRKLIPEPDTNI